MRSRLLLAVAALAVMPVVCRAQEPGRRGLWVETGLGTGVARVGCSACTDVSVVYGRTGWIRIGTSLSQRVLVGAELFGFDDRFPDEPAETADPMEARNASIMGSVLWFPSGSGFFLTGGLGLARGTFTVTPPDGPPVMTRRTGSGLAFGMGLDLPVFRYFAITLDLGARLAAIGDIALPGAPIDDVIASTYHAGIAFTVR